MTSSKMLLFYRTMQLVVAVSLLAREDCMAETITSCGAGTVHRLCCNAYDVISVDTSFYGLADGVTCTEGRNPQEISLTQCSLLSTDVVKKRCDGKKECEVNLDALGTPANCKGDLKYLHTTHTCLPAIHQVVCENSFVHLQCDDFQLIEVKGADYGRRDKTTCVQGRPANQIENTSCSNPTEIVKESCNGKSRCVIKASNTVFGDPCYGTYKYLEVAYICQYPEGREKPPSL